ncbi:Signal recognition particle receptor FtsY [Candidatus Hepatincola sp. Pdp]
MFNFFRTQKLDSTILEQIEDELILADLGSNLTKLVIAELKKVPTTKDIPVKELKFTVARILQKEILKYYKKDTLFVDDTPYVILVSGTNGSGKTTSIAKLASYMKNNGFKVLLAPCDTFRAGATKQLEIWANRIGVDIFNTDAKDPAAVAYQSLEYAKKNSYEVIIVDTSGRLTTNTNLMGELQKIERSLTKVIPESPHESLLVLDATIGQTAVTQAQEFAKAINISGIIMTKLDSESKGGILLNVVKSLQIPVYFIGTGEQESNFKEFHLEDYLYKLLSLSK